MNFETRTENAWLEQLVGDWEFTASAPDFGEMPPGRETVRSLGGFWVVAEGTGQMPNGGTATSLLTIGYDARLGGFTGSWVGSMMPYMFVYQGTLDPAANALTLDCEGPDFATPGKTASYREVITILDAETRTFVSHVEKEDGSWSEMMTARYRRV